jgi:hypothetical protein
MAIAWQIDRGVPKIWRIGHMRKGQEKPHVD